jgi:hypothetical protein
MRKLQLAPPEPLLFADTNWSKFFFAFLVNPANGEFELWRIDKIGLIGQPMNEWKHYLDGSSQDPWRVYIDPGQYR